MAITTCISGNSVKKKGNAATIANAGNVTSEAHTSTLTLRTLSQNKLFNNTFAAVSANSSGNLGTISMFGSSGKFNYQARGQYITRLVGTKINGTASTLLLGGSNKINQRPFNKIRTTRTSFLDVLTWTASRDGQPVYTKTVNNSSLDFLADEATLDITDLVMRTGKPLPVQQAYQTKYSN